MAINTFTRRNGGPLRVRIDEIETATTETLYCTDAAGTQGRVAVTAPTRADSPDWRRGQWYEFSDYSLCERPGDPLVRVTPANVSQLRGESPASVSEPVATKTVSRLGEQPDRLGLTIVVVPAAAGEAIAPASPDSYEVTAVCLDAADTTAEPAVYHREAADAHDERLLLKHVVADLNDTDTETVITWRTGADPIELLAARHDYLEDGDVLAKDGAEIFEGFYYANLSRLGARRGGDTVVETARALGCSAAYPRFDPERLGHDPSEWRADWDLDRTPLSSRTDTRFIERDYRTLLDAHLTGSTPTSDALAACLKRYASAPLEPLRAIAAHDAAESLSCRRLETVTTERD